MYINFYNLAGHKMIIFLADFLIMVLFLGIGVLWIVDGKFKKEQALHALFSALLAWVMAEMIKSLFPTLRPFQVNGRAVLTLFTPHDSSFPSSHEAACFGLSVSVFLHKKTTGIPFLVGALLVGVGRVLGNVHSVIDVVGGAVLGVMATISLRRVHLGRLIGK